MVFSAPADDPFSTLMKMHPGIRLEGTALGGTMVVRVSNVGKPVLSKEELGARLTILREEDEGESTAVLDTPRHVGTLLRRIDHAGLSLLPPLSWEGGRIRLRVLNLGGASPTLIGSILPGAVLESKSDLDERAIEAELSSSGLLLPSLTRKQAKAILAALESGYYESPRKVTTEEVARSLGVARSTFEEHLKAAESKLVSALAPVVRVRLMEAEQGSSMAGAEALSIYAKFSDDLGLYVSLAMRNDKVVRVGLSEAPIEGSVTGENPYLARIIEHIATGGDDLRDIPLDLPITPFEKEVLDLLRNVPPGEVVTYGELAKRLGRPRASRAVGHACASNPAVIVVPCHRAVPASGGLGNYSAPGGPETKRKLLEKEGGLEKVRSGRSKHIV
jgi:O-6-methylguanine DNA methyltransferase